jgi:hypothetical protein
MNVTFEGYSPEGFKMTFSHQFSTFREALDFTANAIKSGVTPVVPDAEAYKEETIVTVIRREKINDDESVTPIIDMYPAWKGEYGQFRFVGVYLNTAADIEAFEMQSGLSLDAIPLYDSQAPLQRKQGRRDRKETTCRPFVARKRVTGEKEIDGETQKVWKFVGYGSNAVPSAAPATTDPTPSPDTPAPRGAVLPLPGKINPATSPRSGRSR